MSDWRSTIAAERMAVDDAFTDRVLASSFSRQQWDLLMTAVRFDIENPGAPADAELVADTDRVGMVWADLESMDGGRSGLAGGGGSTTGDSSTAGASSDGGLLSRVVSLFGGGSGGRRREEAETLLEEYATQLQAEMVDRGTWERVCERAASE